MRFFDKTPVRAALCAALFTGIFTIPLAGQNQMEISSTTTTPGGTVTVEVMLTHDTNVQGFQTALTWDNAILTVGVIDFVGTDLQPSLVPVGSSIEFFTTTTNPALSPGTGWGAAAAIFDFGPPFDAQVLPPGSQQSIVAYQFDSVNDPLLIGTTTDIVPVNGLGSPPIFNVITVSGSSVLPTLVNGSIEFVDLPLFRRGDANNTGTVDIADAIFLIQFLFNAGTSPPCEEAGDANKDSFIDVSDAVYMINFQFLDGPAPPAPYPACGTDPTMTLPCSNYTC